MKGHMIITVRVPRPGSRLPHWTKILESKAGVPERFQSDVDAVLRRNGIGVYPTEECRPGTSGWSPEDVASGLDQVCRLVLVHNTPIPAGLVYDISLIPAVQAIRMGGIAAAPLPYGAASSSTGARTDQRSRDMSFLPEAHRYAEGDPSITVAVWDTGGHVKHKDLRRVMKSSFDFVDIAGGAVESIGDYTKTDPDPEDEVGHGTHVAGIIAGQGKGMPKGVVPRCKVLPVRVLAAMKKAGQRVGAGLVDNINAGINWAVDQGYDVINMSLGIRHSHYTSFNYYRSHKAVF